MTKPWEGDWSPTPEVRVRVRIVPARRERFDLHLHFPAAARHPMAGVDLIVPGLDADGVTAFFEAHAMTDGWSHALPRLAPRPRRAPARSRRAPLDLRAAPLAVAL